MWLYVCGNSLRFNFCLVIMIHVIQCNFYRLRHSKILSSPCQIIRPGNLNIHYLSLWSTDEFNLRFRTPTCRDIFLLSISTICLTWSKTEIDVCILLFWLEMVLDLFVSKAIVLPQPHKCETAGAWLAVSSTFWVQLHFPSHSYLAGRGLQCVNWETQILLQTMQTAKWRLTPKSGH